jgi:hypothetical protein
LQDRRINAGWANDDGWTTAGSPTHALGLREIVIEVSARGCHLGHEDLGAHPRAAGLAVTPETDAKVCRAPRRIGSRPLRLQERAKYLRPSLFELDILLEPEL